MTTLDSRDDAPLQSGQEPPQSGSVHVFWWDRPFLTPWLGFIAYLDLVGSYVFGRGLSKAADVVRPGAETMNGRLLAVLSTQPALALSWGLALGILVLREESERLERLLGWARYLGLFALSGLIGNLAHLLGVAEPTGLAAPFLCVILASSAWTHAAPPRPVGAGMLAWLVAVLLGALIAHYAFTDGRTWAFSTVASALVGTLIVRHQARRRWSTPPTDAPTAEAAR